MIADKIQEHGWHKAQKDWVKELVEEPTKEVRFGINGQHTGDLPTSTRC